MELGIKGKTALVLSAGGGLGSAVAVALAREGVRLCLADISRQALDDTVRRVQVVGGRAESYVFDLASPTQTSEAIGEMLSMLDAVDILFNNTGGPPPGPAYGHVRETWERAFGSMVTPVIGITDLLLPKMCAKGWGRIITSTSSGVESPIPNLGLSNTARISLVGWSKTLAKDVARDGVTVNILVPGRISTARTRFLDGAKAAREKRDVQAVEEESVASIPVGRYGRPEEYADVAAFLASERASYITGAMVRVDGGLIQAL
ncbi:SDR family oxidoreductase [Variovorax paradoxus]|uniref:SDR family oxidoreductase n=1 Tax=Variovorax paradoxus TaxID=34073 RepID=UPI001931B3DA|nr:SDR family oxidoreductase [Variovorax paradoxus]